MTGITYPETSLSGTSSRSSFFEMFKEDYLPQLDKWIHSAEGIQIAKYLLKQRGKMGGQKSVASVFTAQPQSILYGLEGKRLPIPSSATAVNPSIIARSLRYRLQWTEEVLTAARKGSSVAWSAPRAAELELARDQMAINVARNLHHGRYDVLGMISSINGSDQVVLVPENSRRATATAFYGVGAFHLRVGMDVSLVDQSQAGYGLEGSPSYDPLDDVGETPRRLRVASVDNSDPAAPFITLNETDSSGTSSATQAELRSAEYLNATEASGDLIIPWGSRDYTGASYTADASRIGRFAAMNGMVDFLANSTIVPYVMGLTRASYQGLQPQYIHNSGTPVAFEELQVHFLSRQIRRQTGKNVPKLLMNDAMFTEVLRENLPARQFDPVLGQSGAKNLAWVENSSVLKYEVDWQCLPSLIWAFDPELAGYFSEKELSPPPGYDGDHAIQDFAMFEVVASKRGNCLYKRPEVGGALDDRITDQYALTA